MTHFGKHRFTLDWREDRLNDMVCSGWLGQILQKQAALFLEMIATTVNVVVVITGA